VVKKSTKNIFRSVSVLRKVKICALDPLSSLKCLILGYFVASYAYFIVPFLSSGWLEKSNKNIFRTVWVSGNQLWGRRRAGRSGWMPADPPPPPKLARLPHVGERGSRRGGACGERILPSTAASRHSSRFLGAI
jgi:hypothetical protein